MATMEFETVCSTIDNNAEYLNSISQELWKNPELKFEETHAHEILTAALEKCGFEVQKHYFLPTAFKAEFSSKAGNVPVIAIMLEYDALPEIGHGCGHNLIAEAGLAAGLGIKAVMEADPALAGKIVLLGTPAEEKGAGKIKLLEAGAFEGFDAALMVHPTNFSANDLNTLCVSQCFVVFRGKPAHAGAVPWEGHNALDATVSFYQSIALMRQQARPSCRIQAIITNGGASSNIIPDEASLEVLIRALTREPLNDLRSKLENCAEGAAMATGCKASIHFTDLNVENVVTNKPLSAVYKTYADKLGINLIDISNTPFFATDMGNVSHIFPSIHPMFNINTEYNNHAREFTEAAGSLSAQEPTLTAAKAMAMTSLKLMRCSKTMDEVKKQFKLDVAGGL